MAELKITDFDFNIKNKVESLTKIANKEIKNRCWLIRVLFWNDTDFRIELTSSWGEIKDVFIYKKSDNKYLYEKRKYKKDSSYESLIKKEIKK